MIVFIREGKMLFGVFRFDQPPHPQGDRAFPRRGKVLYYAKLNKTTLTKDARLHERRNKASQCFSFGLTPSPPGGQGLPPQGEGPLLCKTQQNYLN